RRMASSAGTDFMREEKRSAFASSDAEDVYLTSQHTILQEQRLLACQATWLSSIDDRIPIQLRPFRGNVPKAFKNFLTALAHNSKKSSELFQVLEVTLAASLPGGIVDQFLKKPASVPIFREYPY